MKKLYTILIAMTFTFAANAQWGQIENGGFENWTDITLYDTPADWVSSNEEEFYGVSTVSQSSDAQDGASSVRIETVLLGSDTLAGYVYHGGSGTSGPDSGIPYTDNFEAVSLHYKTDLPVGDTLYMIYIRYQFGTAIEMQVMPVAYGTNSTWTPALLYIGNQPQDELFIGFIGRNPFGGPNSTPGSWSMVDNVQLLSGGVTTTPLPNPSFETWETATTEAPDSWFTLNSLLIGSGIENAIKTTDANTGSFAIEMTTMQLDQDTIASFLSNGPIDFTSSVPFAPMPYDATPTTISGSYKYAPNNGDQAFLQIQFFQGGAIVGAHAETFTAQSTYTSFSSPLTISGTPDSVSIIAFSGENPGSVLILDDLNFSGNTVELAEFSAMEINMYPNPTRDRVMIKAKGMFNYEIIDLSGNSVLVGSNNQTAVEISVSHLNAGSYFVRISNEVNTETHKLIIQ